LTEIPEHLLRRSRERRAALGLGGEGGGEGEAPPPAGSGPAGAVPARTGAPAPARTAAASAPAVVVEPVVVYVPPAPKGPHKSKVPIWVLPVLAAIPLWAALYPGAFGNHTKATTTDPLVIGSTVFHSVGCAGCHGANGEGGVGPALHGGQAKLTFPNVQDQINWVKTGSAPFAGKKYGDPNRPGGQHGPATGGMPAFGSSLTETQIEDVVNYERNQL
jgi:mono/diheme cytochrome c family protein